MRRSTSTQTLATLGRETSFVGPGQANSESRDDRKQAKLKEEDNRQMGSRYPNRRMHWITIAETEIMAPAENPKHQSLNQKLLFVFWCISSLFESLMKTCLGSNRMIERSPLVRQFFGAISVGAANGTPTAAVEDEGEGFFNPFLRRNPFPIHLRVITNSKKRIAASPMCHEQAPRVVDLKVGGKAFWDAL